MELVIYGAWGIAHAVCEAITHLAPKRKIKCFLVTDAGVNPRTVAGIPVRALQELADSLSEEEKKKIQVLIATQECWMPEIEKSLDQAGLTCHTRMTSERWTELMSCYYLSEKKCMPLQALPIGFHESSLQIYMSKFYQDKPLADSYSLPEYIIPIQVGAALCDERVAEVTDCEGENISEKNPNYSELTALYWMWKNCLSKESTGVEYYGLTHYRRIMELTADDRLRLLDNDVDVVLPYPMPHNQEIGFFCDIYLREGDRRTMERVIEEICPEYKGVYDRIIHQFYLYHHNIIVAKKEVLKEYCDWLFPILERVEELSVPKSVDRKDRYIGYLAEALETVYFMGKKDELNIVHTGFRFMV